VIDWSVTGQNFFFFLLKTLAKIAAKNFHDVKFFGLEVIWFFLIFFLFHIIPFCAMLYGKSINMYQRTVITCSKLQSFLKTINFIEISLIQTVRLQ
jgi:hypothetical protein